MIEETLIKFTEDELKYIIQKYLTDTGYDFSNKSITKIQYPFTTNSNIGIYINNKS